MKENVTLKRLSYNEEEKILDIINNDEILKETFCGEHNTITRILNSSYTGLIQKNDTIIGFIMLVHNPDTNEHELDIGIKSEYRNQGYGTIALSIMKEIITKEQAKVIIQIKNENISAKKMVKKNNFNFVTKDNKYSYYCN